MSCTFWLSSWIVNFEAGATKDQFRPARPSNCFPIISYFRQCCAEYVGYRLGEPAFDVKRMRVARCYVRCTFAGESVRSFSTKNRRNKAIKRHQRARSLHGRNPTDYRKTVPSLSPSVRSFPAAPFPGVFFDHVTEADAQPGKLLYPRDHSTVVREGWTSEFDPERLRVRAY